MAIVSLNISQLNIAQLLQQANNIKTAMTDNPNFVAPNPSLADVGTLISNLANANNDYELLLLAIQEKLTLRGAAEQALTDGLVALAGYVQTASGGDLAKILSAGMKVRAGRVSKTVPRAVSGLSVTPGDAPGQLNLSWDTMSVSSFEVQTCTDPAAGNWTHHPSVTRAKTSLSGFASGSQVWSRVRAVNAAGIGAWSSEIAKIAP